jgi:hypothetical protein
MTVPKVGLQQQGRDTGASANSVRPDARRGAAGAPWRL